MKSGFPIKNWHSFYAKCTCICASLCSLICDIDIEGASKLVFCPTLPHHKMSLARLLIFHKTYGVGFCYNGDSSAPSRMPLETLHVFVWRPAVILQRLFLSNGAHWISIEFKYMDHELQVLYQSQIFSSIYGILYSADHLRRCYSERGIDFHHVFIFIECRSIYHTVTRFLITLRT